MSKRVIFAGTPEFAAQALRAILAAGFDVPLVLTQPDRPAGRGMQMQASAVKQVALEHGIAVAQPQSLRLDGKYPEVAQEAHTLLRNTPHDVMVVAAYGLILPPTILAIPPAGCLNIHASLLPRWRGAAPIHRAIQAGDAETGITIMQMDEGLDTGAMLLKERVNITPELSTAKLHDVLADLGGRMIVDALQRYHELEAQVQPETGVCYAEKIRKDESALDFTRNATELRNQIHAFDPFPGCVASVGDKNFKIWNATAHDKNVTTAPGTLLSADAQQGIQIACGQGVLELTELQKPGGKRLSAKEFLAGFVLQVGDRLH